MVIHSSEIVLTVPHTQEATQNSIRLEEDDPDALNVLINFLYRYNAAISTPATKTPQTFAVAVYGKQPLNSLRIPHRPSAHRQRARTDLPASSVAIADKYAVPALRATAASHLGMILNPAADLEDFLSALRAVDNQVCEISAPLGGRYRSDSTGMQQTVPHSPYLQSRDPCVLTVSRSTQATWPCGPSW